MSFFSKERLLGLVAYSKRHRWVFLPALLIILIGYAACTVADYFMLLLLSVRNLILKCYCAVRRGFKKTAAFISKKLKAAHCKASAAVHSGASKIRKMNDNARTARSQLLNDAVNYCVARHNKRAEKKQSLRAQAHRLLREGSGDTRTEELSVTESAIAATINKAAV